MLVRRPIHIAVTSLLALTACSAEVSIGNGGVSPAEAAEAFIEGQGADEVGEPLDADCDDPVDPAVGTRFDCSAALPDGRIVDFVAEIGDDASVSVESTNLIVADQLGLLEGELAAALGDQIGVDVPAGNVDCGDDHVVFVDERTLACVFTDPGDGVAYDATVTVDDLVAGDFRYVIEDVHDD